MQSAGDVLEAGAVLGAGAVFVHVHVHVLVHGLDRTGWEVGVEREGQHEHEHRPAA